MSHEERVVLENPSKDKTIIICKPDKGNGVAVMNRDDYVRKMNKILQDSTKFKKVANDINIKNLAKFQRFLYNLKKKQHLDDETYRRIRPVAEVTPTLYSLPKIHKPENPCRPILALSGSYTYEYASWLNGVLTPYRHHQTTTKDIFDFVKKLNKVHPTSSDVLVSFVVKSLFTNIPIYFTNNLLLNLVFDGKAKDGKFYRMNKQQLKKMLEWATKETILQFNGSYYEQTKGLAMGTPIAPLLADICMNWVINKTSKSHV